MFELTNNYFLSPKRTTSTATTSTPRSRAVARNKVSVGLLLANILKTKITKQLEEGFGKIMIEGLPRVSYNKFQLFKGDTESSYFSTTMCTPESTPKNSFKINKQENMLKAGNSRLLKKRSSLNETRAVINNTIEKSLSPSINPQRTYAPSNKELTKQLDGFKMMRLSCQIRTILQKVGTFDKKNFAYELQKLCKDQFSKQIRKLEKVKNSSKDLRGEVFDNELTMAVLNSNIKMIGDLNKELQEIKKSHIENQKQLRLKTEQNERMSTSTQKLEKHRENIGKQMKVFTNRIEQQLNRRQLGKALIGINEFMKKYENEDYAKQKVYFYNLLKQRINDYKEIEKCLDQVCRILGVLGIADFNHTDACIRSLTSNSSAFKYIKRVYGNIDKFYGKQMTNIIHNLEKFNNNIVMYLEAAKQVDRQMNKPTGIQELKKQHSLQITNLNGKIQEQKRKIALLEMEIEKKNFKINNSINPIISENENTKKIQNEFERKLNDILTKIGAKKDFKNELEAFRKSPILSAEKPYAQFINLTFALQRVHDENIKSEIQSLSGMFDEISKVFRKSFTSQQAMFKELLKVLNVSGRKNVFYFDLHRFLQSLMFTIVHKTKQTKTEEPTRDQFVTKITKAQPSISVPIEKKRSRRFSENFMDFKFEAQTIRQDKSCVNNFYSPKSIGCYDEKEQDLGEYNEKEMLKQMELFLNKISPILHRPNGNMEKKLEEVQNLAEKFIVNNYKYKQVFSSLENWISFAISRLELKGTH